MNKLISLICNNFKVKMIFCFGLWIILTSSSFAMLNLPFIWISYVPLIFIIHQMKLREITIYGFVAAFIYYLCTLFWLIAFHEISLLFVFPLYSLYFVAAMIFIRYVSEKFPKIRFLIFPLIWTSFEIFRGIGFLGFRWNTPADALWKQLIFLQSADIIGSWGVSFIILLVNSTIAEVLLVYPKYNSWRQSFLKNFVIIYLTMFIFLCNLAYGISAYKQWSNIVDTKLYKEKIALFQPNRPGHSSWYREQKELSKKYLEMIDSVTNQKPDLYLQTEIMLSTYVLDDIKNYGLDHPINQYISPFIKKSKELDTPIMITHFGIDKNEKSYNSATLIKYSNNTYHSNTYNKIHIVPFGEWVPGVHNWKWLSKILKNIGASWASPGTELTIFTSKNKIKFAMLICFEDIFAILGRLFVKKGAQYFVNSTNDGWAYRWRFGSKVPLWQHLANTIHTSISLRRSIARSVNTGISAVIDPVGRINIAPIKEYADGVHVADIPVMPKDFLSQYVNFGWIISYLIYFISIFIIIFTIFTDHKAQILKKIL